MKNIVTKAFRKVSSNGTVTLTKKLAGKKVTVTQIANGTYIVEEVK